MAIVDVIPSAATLATSRSSLYKTLPEHGVGNAEAQRHLEQDVAPALSLSSVSASYYGFVTGGATPAAALADNIVTKYDQNVQVHLPNETVATDVEDGALRMLCDLVRLRPDHWTHRTFTTGATASNVVGLACGREHVIAEAARRNGVSTSVAEDGLIDSMHAVGIDRIQILTTLPHSSLRKAASIVGLGRSCVRDVGQSSASHRFDFAILESALQVPRIGSIVAVSTAEVNTGFFATAGEDMQRIRGLCDKYGAWLHIDAAFGLQARILPEHNSEFEHIISGVRGLELADSITGDAHKLLNVPYDCGIFLSRHLPVGIQVFQNPNAAYLDAGGNGTALNGEYIPSPLNISIENSRRFRALPVYSTLMANGRQGYRDILMRQIRLSREISRFIQGEPRLELLPTDLSAEEAVQHTYVVVLFCAKDDAVNKDLVRRINASRQIYVSGTAWAGRPAARFAVANWQVDVERDISLIRKVLLDTLV